jgi:PAS domain S-box-containing protein
VSKTRSTRNTKGEIERLRARLAEAEETLSAIRNGEVDAIAVDGPRGRQLFTLQSAEQPYRVLAERMSEGAASMTAEGTILFCNQRLAEMVGRTPETMVGLSVTLLVPPGARKDFQEFLARGLEDEARREVQFQRSDGSVIPVLASLNAIPSDQGPGLCLIAMDFSEHKQAEETIRLQASQYAALLATTSDGYWRFDHLGKLLDVNDVYCQMSGYSRNELLKLHIADIVTGEKPAELLRHIKKVATTGFDRFGSKHCKKNGEIIDVEVSASYFQASNEFILFARDITARKQAELKLREQAALLDLAHDAILLRGLDGRILFWNRGAVDLYGWSAEEILGKVAHTLLRTEFPISLEDLQTSIQETREWEGELKHVCRDGSEIVVASRWSLLRDERAKPVAIMEINRDITDRKQAEEALRKASHYTRSLIEASLDPLVTISREGKITDVNEATEKLTGISRQRLIGTDFSDYFTEPERSREGYEKVFAEGAVHDYPLAIRSASGVVTDVLYNASVFRNDAGEVEGVFAAARDVTERKRAELALKKASLYTRSLIEASLDPLVTISQEGRITDVNEATEKVTGVSRQRLIGTDFSNYFTQPEMARRGYRQVFAEGSVTDYPLALRHASGKVTEVLYNASVFRNEAGEVEGVFAAARDVTERKQAEEEVRKLNEELEQRVTARTEELRVLNKELEAFNYAVAHDLRAPLRHIHGFAEMLGEEARPVLTDSGKHQLGTILDSVQHMSQLLEDLLKLSRLGRQELCKQVCSANSLIAEVVKALEPESKGREVEWRITDLPAVQCDPPLFKQVLVNLLSNALKFTRTRHPAIIEIGQTTIDGEAAIFIRDNGVGFSMKYADKLFGLFQRLHSQQDFEGTGVGLAIVQRIMHRHGGRVWAEAEPDKGATFYLILHSCEAAKPELAVAHGAV